MTNLERLIKAHVEAATVATLSGATERIAEEMARELLKDEAFRSEMQSLVRRHFTTTMQGREHRQRDAKADEVTIGEPPRPSRAWPG
jgi:phosphoserine phosphatase